MAKDPAFPFYASDWLGSSQIAVMDAEQERGYLRLLCHMWNSDCALPDDDAVLARLSLMGEGWLKGGCQMVRGCFTNHPDKPGFITNEKLLAIKAERDAWRAKSSEGGKNSAQLRKSRAESKGGTKGGSTTVGTKGATKRQPNGNSPSPSPSSISSPNGEPPVVPKGTEVYSAQFVDFWTAYPRKEGKQKAYRYWRSAVKRVRTERSLAWQAAADFILEAVQAFAATPLGKAGEFCPHPSTWLNAGRWDDDRAEWNRVKESSGKAAKPPEFRFGDDE